MHTLKIDDILFLGDKAKEQIPAIEHYFSPTRKERFIKDYLHYLNTTLLEARHGNLNLEMYLSLVLNFQFVSPLLEIHTVQEFDKFMQTLKQRYLMDAPDIHVHFTEAGMDEGMLDEKEALLVFKSELEESYPGKREVKGSVQKKLKADGIEAIMKWQQTKGLSELAEAFGRSIVIPVFFSFIDKKLVGFYKNSTNGIRYEVAVPEFEI